MELPTTEPLTALGRHRGEAADDIDNDDDDTECDGKGGGDAMVTLLW